MRMKYVSKYGQRGSKTLPICRPTLGSAKLQNFIELMEKRGGQNGNAANFLEAWKHKGIMGRF